MNKLTGNRLVSLDVMRGLIMILLAGESALVYESLRSLAPPATGGAAGQVFRSLVGQFFHHPWHGLHFWDLVQPAFMMMAGTAMYISFAQKAAGGVSWSDNLPHIALRSAKLFLLGTALHCVYAGKLVWELWNVLTQLSVTSLVAYLIIRRSGAFQVIAGCLLIAISDILYRSVLMPGFDQPFVEYHNFGAYIDTVLMGKINTDGWVAINILPTAAHTIWGMVAGRWLVSDRTPAQKVRLLLAAGCLGLVLGYGLDWASITPIIKRISTGSFVLASAGWVLLILACLYWIIDIRKYQKYAWVATVVGMNALFIYLFFETVGAQWVNPATGIFIRGFSGLLHMPPKGQAVLNALMVWFLEWGLCYWLFRKKIFIKL